MAILTDSGTGTTLPFDSPALSAAQILLGLMLVAAPLPFGAVFTWAWAALTLCVVLILILWAAGSMGKETLCIGYTPLYIPLSLLLVLGFVQWLWRLTLDPIATRESLVKLGTDFVLFFVVVQLFARARVETWRRTGVAVLAYGFVLSFLSVLQFLWNPSRILWVDHNLGGPFGPYVDRDHYAGLMEMVIPIAACFVLSRPRRDPRQGALWFAVLIPVVSLMLTGSRGGMVALFAETAILAWIAIRGTPLPKRRTAGVVAGMALVAVAALFFWLAPAGVLTKLGTFRNYATEAHSGRVALWRDSLHLIHDHPWLGAGMGSFATVYPPYQSEPSELVTEHAHNDYLEAVTETGVAGGALILAALALFIANAFRDLSGRLRRGAGWIQLGAVIACCGLLIHSFVDFNLRIPANAAWFAFCAGLAVQPGNITPARDDRPSETPGPSPQPPIDTPRGL